MQFVCTANLRGTDLESWTSLVHEGLRTRVNQIEWMRECSRKRELHWQRPRGWRECGLFGRFRYSGSSQLACRIGRSGE